MYTQYYNNCHIYIYIFYINLGFLLPCLWYLLCSIRMKRYNINYYKVEYELLIRVNSYINIIYDI